MRASIRAAINRENASHSTGPVTAAGKSRVRLNAWRHGLTAEAITHTDEESAAHLEFCREFIAHLRPVGPAETQLAQSIADTHWRLNRIVAIENNLLNGSLLDHIDSVNPAFDTLAAIGIAQARAWAAGANTFDKLGRYEARLTRMLVQLTAQLHAERAARRLRSTSPEISQPIQNETLNRNSALFGKTSPAARAACTHRWAVHSPAAEIRRKSAAAAN